MMNLITVPNATGGAVGGWRHPAAWNNTVMNLEHMISIAQTAERGKFDCIFFADGNGVRQLDRPELFAALTPTDRPAGFEPVTLLSALAMHTSNIGLVSTATTTYESPYLLSRKFASLDHLSGGRAGWNIVTTSTPEDSKNFGLNEHIDRDSRYARAEEFVEVVTGLWDSWAEDAFIQDKASGQFLDPSRVHVLDHDGKFLKVKGPLNVSRSPQGHPVKFTAGQSETGKELAAKLADCVFALAMTKEAGQALMKDIKGRLARYGRSADSLKIIPGAGVFVGRTAEEADEMYQEVAELITPELGVHFLSKMLSHDLSGLDVDGPVPQISSEAVLGIDSIRRAVDADIRAQNLTIRQAYQRIVPALGHPIFKGTAKQVADHMEDWYTSGACDGFMITAPIAPVGFDRFVDLVVPELQRRGLFRKEYTGRTLRETMGLPSPANQFFPCLSSAAE
jgi:FMN-dependent oxidoreductase (nitrilotriacetate monooxygenase family)